MICSGAGDVDDDAAAVAHLLYNYYYMLVALPTFCVREFRGTACETTQVYYKSFIQR